MSNVLTRATRSRSAMVIRTGNNWAADRAVRDEDNALRTAAGARAIVGVIGSGGGS